RTQPLIDLRSEIRQTSILLFHLCHLRRRTISPQVHIFNLKRTFHDSRQRPPADFFTTHHYRGSKRHRIVIGSSIDSAVFSANVFLDKNDDNKAPFLRSMNSSISGLFPCLSIPTTASKPRSHPTLRIE